MDLLINDRHTSLFQENQKKVFVNLAYDWPILQYQDIAKSLTKGEFAQNSKNRSDIYEHVLIHPYLVLMQMFKLETKISNRSLPTMK